MVQSSLPVGSIEHFYSESSKLPTPRSVEEKVEWSAAELPTEPDEA